MKTTEHQEQVKLYQWIRLHENKHPALKTVFAIPNGGKRPVRKNKYGQWYCPEGKKLKDEGVKAGVWDNFVMYPKMSKETTDGNNNIIYCGLWIEMKIKPNKLTANQIAFRELGKEYYKHEKCYSADEAIEVLREYLEI